jgi:hypothetical protein
MRATNGLLALPQSGLDLLVTLQIPRVFDSKVKKVRFAEDQELVLKRPVSIDELFERALEDLMVRSLHPCCCLL